MDHTILFYEYEDDGEPYMTRDGYAVLLRDISATTGGDAPAVPPVSTYWLLRRILREATEYMLPDGLELSPDGLVQRRLSSAERSL